MKKTIKDTSFTLPRFKIVLFYTLVFSLAAHAYMYFAFAPSHDSISTLINSPGDGRHQLSLGRFMQPVYWLLRGRLPTPWLVGILSILYLAVSGYLIFDVLGFSRRSSIVLLCGIFSTNLTITATNATYFYSIDTYTLALVFACVGVWLWERQPKWGALGAIPALAASMGSYQAYIDAAIGMALLLLIKAVMEGETFSALWRRALRYALSLLGGGALYFVCVKLVMWLSHIGTSPEYAELRQIFENGSVSILSLLKLIPYAYFNFAAFFFSPLRAYNTPALCLFRLLMVSFGLCMWVRCIRRQHIRGPELAVLLLCVALLPLGLNFVYVLSTGHIHDLMRYSYFLVYVLLLMPMELSPVLPPDRETEAVSPERRIGWPRFCRSAALLLCALMVFHNIVFANGAYYYKQIVYDASSQYAFSIVEQIEQEPDYEPGVTPVVFIGELAFSAASRAIADDAFSQYRHVTGMWNSTSVTYPGSFQAYFTLFLGHPVNIDFSRQRHADLLSLQEVQDMPVFPKEGYCRMIDGVMVVKLEDPS